VNEILPGVVHWRARHPNLHSEVDSWWLAGSGVLIDALVPPDVGLEWFASQDVSPSAIVLSNRHHYRGAAEFRERFGCSVHVPRAGLHEFGADRQPVDAYDPGDELPGGLVVHEIGSLCPDDMALHLPAAQAVFFADGVVVWRGGDVGFVPDSLMDDPERTKRGLVASLRRLLDDVPDFRHVLMAHGGPVLDEGRAKLEALVAL
jgi:glyoxylase-like metal-dependent hydrolase (beta-lactamase superfamily II)